MYEFFYMLKQLTIEEIFFFNLFMIYYVTLGTSTLYFIFVFTKKNSAITFVQLELVCVYC